MRRLIAAAAMALLAGCASAATAVSGSGGPLGTPDGGSGGICFGFYPGEVLTDGFTPLENASSHPVTITRMWVTGLRQMRVDGIYADVFTPSAPGPGGPGPGQIGDAYGWPRRSWRHPAAGAVIPPHGYLAVLAVVTARGPSAFAAGLDASYSSQGQSYLHVTTFYLGHARTCPPVVIPRSQARAVYEKVIHSKDPEATLRKLSEADLYLYYLATRITGERGSSTMKLVSPPP